MNKNIFQSLKIIVLASVLSFGISYVSAWTAPTVTPPNGNVSAPINVSGTAQAKAGAFGVGTAAAPLDATVRLQVSGGNILTDNATDYRTKNSTGGTEQWMWPRWSDGVMYTNFGANGWNIRNNASESVMFMGNNGNVGVRTTTPQDEFHIKEQNGSTDTELRLEYSGSGGGTARQYSIAASYDGNFHILDKNLNTQRFTVKSDGNVGIGVVNPTQKLDVAGNIKASGSVCNGSGQCVGGSGAETDPTVPASVKDGIAWSEISGIPGGFSDGLDNTGISLGAAFIPAIDNDCNNFQYCDCPAGAIQVGISSADVRPMPICRNIQ